MVAKRLCSSVFLAVQGIAAWRITCAVAASWELLEVLLTCVQCVFLGLALDTDY